MRLIRIVLGLLPVKKHYLDTATSCYKDAFANSDGGRVVSLDDDALMEILVRLPLKSVTRFQLVCKLWLSLISTYYFRGLYTLRKYPRFFILPTFGLLFSPFDISLNIIKPSDFFYHNKFFFYPNENEKKQPRIRVIPFDIDGIYNVHILNCSNGLMLLKKCNLNEYYVYNPATKHSQKLEHYNGVSMLHLVFDPSVSPHYKIVCSLSSEEMEYIHVFSSKKKKGAWRVCGKPFYCGGGGITNVVKCKNFIYFINNNAFLYCFNIVKNGSPFKVCRLPKLPEAETYSIMLRESDGCLYYCSLFSDYHRLHISAGVWELQVKGNDPHRSNWFLKYVHRVHPFPCLRIKLLTFVAETSTVLIEAPEKIVAYCFLDQSYKVLLLEQPLAFSVDVQPKLCLNFM